MNQLAINTFLLVAVTVVFGCDNYNKTSGSNSRGDLKPLDSKTLEAAQEVYSDNKTVDEIDSYQGVRGTGFIVKNNIQLKAAAEACLGPGLGVITDDMFAQGRCPGAAGGATGDRLVILGADKCSVRGKHIYEVLKGQLWSPDLAGRTDTLSNQLTPSYLQALAQSADVYAHGVSDPSALCSTSDKAKDFLTRCLAQIASNDLAQAAEKISTLCSQGGAKAREAIATVLGSAAFAAASPKDSEPSAVDKEN
jgi:hypothetical protein